MAGALQSIQKALPKSPPSPRYAQARAKKQPFPADPSAVGDILPCQRKFHRVNASAVDPLVRTSNAQPCAFFEQQPVIVKERR